MNKRLIAVMVVCFIIASCSPLPKTQLITQQLCPAFNPVFVEHKDNDSAMYWIPNCFAPGDSTSLNDSLIEFGRNLAQVVVTITDSSATPPVIIAYDNHAFQNTGFVSHTVWYGNYSNSPVPEKSYSVTVTGTTLFGTNFSLNGTVSVLRYFFGKSATGTINPVLVYCDTCLFNSQWSGTGVNPQLPTHEIFVPDANHHCD
jgi:hypothetical protein